MTEIHPMANKELTPIEFVTPSRTTSPPNVNPIFTIKLKKNQNVADGSKGKSTVLNVASQNVVRMNGQGPNYSALRDFLAFSL